MSKKNITSRDQLIHGNITPSIENMIGKVFNKFTVLEFVGYRVTPNGSKMPMVECLCECGNLLIGNATHILYGHSKSCGCHTGEFIRIAKTQHGYAPLNTKQPRVYRIWKGMKKRCCNSNEVQYKYYGAKGICVCEGWRDKNGFINFLKDMGEPGTELSLDRINGNLNYSCGHCDECIKNGWALNCRWADDFQQSK